MIAAISRPSGDHTGPRFSRMPIDLCGSGIEPAVRRERSRPVADGSGSTCTHSTWLVPSRNRVEYGCSADITTARPSGDQLGRPGSFNRSCTWRPSRLLTSTTLQLRGGIEVGQTRAVRRPRRWSPPAPTTSIGPVRRSRTQRSIAPPRSDENASACRRATTPGSSRRRRRWSVARARPPRRGRHRPQIAERGKRHARAIRARSPGASGRGPAAGPSGAKSRRFGVNAGRVKATSR